MSEPIYSRAPDVVWRLGPDRVLVRRIGDHGDDAAAELMGAAALVWVALDEPGTVRAVTARLSAAEVGSETEVGEAERGAVDELIDCRWVRAP